MKDHEGIGNISAGHGRSCYIIRHFLRALKYLWDIVGFDHGFFIFLHHFASTSFASCIMVSPVRTQTVSLCLGTRGKATTAPSITMAGGSGAQGCRER